MQKSGMGDILNTLDAVRHTTAQFLIIDLETALTFVQITETSDVPETKARNRRNATRVYEFVCDYLRKHHLSDDDAERAGFLLDKLRRSLERLGETV